MKERLLRKLRELDREKVQRGLVHLRMRSWPIVAAHFGAGALIALLNTPPGSRGIAVVRILVGMVVWVICMNGATLALNSAYDRDEGDIGYLDDPPPPPEGLAAGSILLMLMGLVISFLLPIGFSYAYATCMLLSLAYSVPPLRLKAVAGADVVINMIGYGALTFGAGAWAAGTIADPDLLKAITWLAVSFGFLFGAFYPMTQIYQVPEDEARGDKTLVIWLGVKRALQLSLVAVIAVLILQQMAASTAHIPVLARFVLLISTGAWIWLISDWLHHIDTYPAKRGMYRALELWAVSDVAVILAFM